jgi:hypothetical protein
VGQSQDIHWPVLLTLQATNRRFGVKRLLHTCLGYPIAALAMLVPMAAIPIIFSLYRYKQLERHGEL